MSRLRRITRRVVEALDPGEDYIPPPAGAPGTAGAGYRIPTPRTQPRHEHEETRNA